MARGFEGPAFAAAVAAGSEDSRESMIESDLDHGVIRLPAHSPTDRIAVATVQQELGADPLAWRRLLRHAHAAIVRPINFSVL